MNSSTKTRRATRVDWLQIDPVLEADELGIETDTHLFKLGNGVKKWSDLEYDSRSSGQFTECRPLLIGGIPATPSDPPPDKFEPPVMHTAFVVDEKRLVLNDAADPRTVGDMDASFGGIVLKGFRDHFWLYDYANNAWNTSDNINLSCETGLLIDNRKALDEHKVRVGNRTKGGKIYLGSGEHDTWRIGADEHGNLIAEYRRLDGQWVFKGRIGHELTDTDKGKNLPEAANPYIERSGDPAKQPTLHHVGTNHGQRFWPLFQSQHGKLHAKLFLNTDDAFALGRIMKRTVNFNGVIPGPLLKAKAGDTLEIDFYNELDDLGELEPWNDGMMQQHVMLHMHLDDRVYALDGEVDENNREDDPDKKRKIEENDLRLKKATTWMQHIMMRGATNLHTHGFHVRPDSFGDNVMRSAKPGSRLRYRYKLPDNHFGGLQWFHPHGHGGSQNLITRGAIGTILIEGPYQDRLNRASVEREYIILQRIQWGENLNSRDELNWVDYVSNLPTDLNDPDLNEANAKDETRTTPKNTNAIEFSDDEIANFSDEVRTGIQQIFRLDDLSPYYRDNLDPKCICSCAAIGGGPHVHGDGRASIATPDCEAVDVRWVPAVNGQKQPVFTAKLGELKIFSMLNATGLTFFRIAIQDHDIVIAGRDGIPQVPSSPALKKAAVDPDFVYNPAGQRLNYVICNSGQRFEFFAIPKQDLETPVGVGEYSILTLPISETQIFADGLNAPVRIATLRYDGTLDPEASNHESELEGLLPDPNQDDPDNIETLPKDRTGWKYICSLVQLRGLLDGLQTTATVFRATLTVDGSLATIVMPNDEPHNLEVGARIGVGGADYIIDSLDDHDHATFHIAVPAATTASLPGPGIVDFNYDLYKLTTINNGATGNVPLEIVEMLTDHYFYRKIEIPDKILKNLEPFIVRQRQMSFAIHKHGLAGSGSDSTLMNDHAFDDFDKIVGYLGTNEEIVIENKSDVLHLFHIHINYFQVMGYRDAAFGNNAVDKPTGGDNGLYKYETEILVPFEGFEDTVSIPVGVMQPDGGDALDGARGQVRVRISHEDYTGLFLMHCHLLDDQDMGMMQEVEVVNFGYEQPHVHESDHAHA